MQWDTPTHLREKRNTSIAGNVTKYSILHSQESFDQLYSPKGRHNNKIKKNRKYITRRQEDYHTV